MVIRYFLKLKEQIRKENNTGRKPIRATAQSSYDSYIYSNWNHIYQKLALILIPICPIKIYYAKNNIEHNINYFLPTPMQCDN